MMNDPLLESAKEIEALRAQVAMLVDGRLAILKTMREFGDQLAAMTQERDAYRSVAEGEPLDAYQAVCDQLAVAQARIKELREALEYYACDSGHEGTWARRTLVTSDYSSALDAELKAEREKVIEFIRNGYQVYDNTLMEAIRSMK